MQLEGSARSHLKFYFNPYNHHFYFADHYIKPEDQENSSVGGQPLEHPFFLTSFDEAGNFLWKREVTGGTDQLYSPKDFNIVFDSADNIYMGGRWTSTAGVEFIGFSIPEEVAPFFILKLDPTAEEVLWSTYNDVNLSDTHGSLVLNEGTDELAFCAQTGGYSEFTWEGQSIVPFPDYPGGAQGSSPFIAFFDPATGECTGLDYIPITVGYLPNYADALAVDAAGDYLMGGGFSGSLTDVNGDDVWNKGGETDFFISKYATQACNEPVAGVESFGQTPLKAYPNPVKNKLRVNVKRSTNYQLYGLNGRLAQQGRLTPGNNSLPTIGLEKGIYFLRLKDQQGRHQVIKVVKE